MKYPKYITDTDTIGFAAPSFGCSVEPYKSAFQNALKVLQEKGHGLMLGPNVYEGSGTGISASPLSCGRELTDMYLSKDNRALISCGGGELMCEILDHVDFDRIREAEPKWYMGYSDNTNFTFLLNTLCDTASIYGPCAPAFGMQPWHPAIWDAYSLLRGEKKEFLGYPLFERESLKDEEHPLEPYNAVHPRQIRIYVPARDVQSEGQSEGQQSGVLSGDAKCEKSAGMDTPGEEINAADAKNSTVRGMALTAGPVAFSGRLLGGCMDCLVNLTGTKYDRVRDFNERYRKDGIIWFLESCDLNVFAIRRAIWQMEHAGWFEHVKGFLIGRPYCHGQVMMDLDQYRAVAEPLAGYGVPVIMDLDIGHLPPMIPIMCGALANVRVQGDGFYISYM